MSKWLETVHNFAVLYVNANVKMAKNVSKMGALVACQCINVVYFDIIPKFRLDFSCERYNT
jgi:hypothetical protein